MLKSVNRINKKLIYKLHLENDKIIDMPMFLVDDLYIRNKEELICLLKHAITFNKNDFLYNYKRVLLKDDALRNNKIEYSGIFDQNGIENDNYTDEYIAANKNIKDKNVNKKSSNNSCVELEINKIKCDDTLNNIINDMNINKNYNSDYIRKEKKNLFFKNKDKKLSQILNPYKYDNEEYNELINCLSEINEYEENYNSNYLYFYENIMNAMDKPIEKEIVENESTENYIQYIDNRKKIKDKNILMGKKMPEYYSLIGYIPNNYFFYNYKNRIISLIEYLSYTDICSLIYLYSRSEQIDFSILTILGKQYINKIEKDKKYNYKNTIKLLNIFIKLSYKKNEMQYIIKKLLKSLYMCTYCGDLKIATLHFVCLSKLNLYNILFYDYINIFLKNINNLSHLSCSIILQCLGYYRYYMITSRNYIFKLVKEFKQKFVSEIGKNIFQNKDINTIEKENEWKKILRNKIEIQILTFQHGKKNIDLINDIENKIIDRLTKINLDDISEKSIGNIFHFYYLINKKILTNSDHILFFNLVNVLIKNKINFQKPRSFLMSSYTLIIYKYFTNINISCYFLLQCSKLIKILKKEFYMSNLLFVLIGFSQNQLIFYKNRNNNNDNRNKNNLNASENNFIGISASNINDNYPEVYIDKKYNKLCNFKIENKYKDMTEMCEYKINCLENKLSKPVSSRSAILSIFNEITNLEYKLNIEQMRMYLLLFSSFDIKLSSEIKQKILSLIINDSKSLVYLPHIIIQTSIKIFGISSNYMKTICLSLLEKMNFEIMKFFKIIKSDEKTFLNYIKSEQHEEIQDSEKRQQFCNYLWDLNILSEILFIFDQIDINKSDFIVNIVNLMCFNNFLIFKYKKNSFSSYVYFLHYIGSNKLDTESYKKLSDFIFINLSDYIDLSYKYYLKNHVEKLTNIRNINGFNKTNVDNSIEYDIFFDEVDHKIIMDKIYVKDILLLLDAIRILKAYNYASLLSNSVSMLNTDKIKTLSDEDIELANYIFIDMGLYNKYIMDEVKNRGLTIGLK
ncbi:conserved Plasmodium protein, unknown function [Plasmodium berghei]|uniref:Uncharacterized protein n=2 Tax=Plasmodium berghei TaxID=5821 RepID=A0A509ABP9_PLABA|nr:conserved Plasmodium protein, unknown function [Plasmodium berghei ANKA]CXH89361.1 conserved Plasmodium protein, unknown function [Plasmodium berghei]SCL90323.1 conserved Plasmodium protein, unknown function [Plasmodium berghei]SCM15268.1 conserved Plasmodium protein, unknown function [Plasmodium berghei]SCM17063.1 conserved Plasmodium protein, unknown function [Plasmodium berghei]SCN21958.1 conserved Plasmodium protein, unknown function [Plasmodium berghei]|eukprot:XP_034419843.1 conserved Plasmodium protein, unknown function [Plasmodium berghei ANKA]